MAGRSLDNIYWVFEGDKEFCLKHKSYARKCVGECEPLFGNVSIYKKTFTRGDGLKVIVGNMMGLTKVTMSYPINKKSDFCFEGLQGIYCEFPDGTAALYDYPTVQGAALGTPKAVFEVDEVAGLGIADYVPGPVQKYRPEKAPAANQGYAYYHCTNLYTIGSGESAWTPHFTWLKGGREMAIEFTNLDEAYTVTVQNALDPEGGNVTYEGFDTLDFDIIDMGEYKTGKGCEINGWVVPGTTVRGRSVVYSGTITRPAASGIYTTQPPAMMLPQPDCGFSVTDDGTKLLINVPQFPDMARYTTDVNPDFKWPLGDPRMGYDSTSPNYKVNEEGLARFCHSIYEVDMTGTTTHTTVKSWAECNGHAFVTRNRPPPPYQDYYDQTWHGTNFNGVGQWSTLWSTYSVQHVFQAYSYDAYSDWTGTQPYEYWDVNAASQFPASYSPILRHTQTESVPGTQGEDDGSGGTVDTWYSITCQQYQSYVPPDPVPDGWEGPTRNDYVLDNAAWTWSANPIEDYTQTIIQGAYYGYELDGEGNPYAVIKYHAATYHRNQAFTGTVTNGTNTVRTKVTEYKKYFPAVGDPRVEKRVRNCATPVSGSVLPTGAGSGNYIDYTSNINVTYKDDTYYYYFDLDAGDSGKLPIYAHDKDQRAMTLTLNTSTPCYTDLTVYTGADADDYNYNPNYTLGGEAFTFGSWKCFHDRTLTSSYSGNWLTYVAKEKVSSSSTIIANPATSIDQMVYTPRGNFPLHDWLSYVTCFGSEYYGDFVPNYDVGDACDFYSASTYFDADFIDESEQLPDYWTPKKWLRNRYFSLMMNAFKPTFDPSIQFVPTGLRSISGDSDVREEIRFDGDAKAPVETAAGYYSPSTYIDDIPWSTVEVSQEIMFWGTGTAILPPVVFDPVTGILIYDVTAVKIRIF